MSRPRAAAASSGTTPGPAGVLDKIVPGTTPIMIARNA